MVGVASLSRWRDDHTRLEPANRARQQRARRRIVDDSRVGQCQVFTRRESHDARRLLGLVRAGFCVALGAHLSSGEIDDRGRVALLRCLDQGAGAGELHVVTVGRYGEKVNRHGGEASGRRAGDAQGGRRCPCRCAGSLRR